MSLRWTAGASRPARDMTLHSVPVYIQLQELIQSGCPSFLYSLLLIQSGSKEKMIFSIAHCLASFHLLPSFPPAATERMLLYSVLFTSLSMCTYVRSLQQFGTPISFFLRTSRSRQPSSVHGASPSPCSLKLSHRPRQVGKRLSTLWVSKASVQSSTSPM